MLTRTSRLGGLRDIRLQQQRRASGLGDERLDLTRILLLGSEVCDRYIGTLARECDGHRPPDAAVAAGNERSLSSQAAMALVAALAMVRRGVHRTGLARKALFLRRKRRPLVKGRGVVAHDLCSAAMTGERE